MQQVNIETIVLHKSRNIDDFKKAIKLIDQNASMVGPHIRKDKEKLGK